MGAGQIRSGRLRSVRSAARRRDAVPGRRAATGAAALAVAALLLPFAPSASTASAAAAPAVAPPAASLVSEVPSAITPRLDGDNAQVHAVTKVGNLIVVGGDFSQVAALDGSSAQPRANLVAFDATTGAVVTGFAPQVDGEVDALAPGPDGTSVFVGGNFDTVDGRPTQGIARLSLTDGSPVAGFSDPVLDQFGDVNALVVDGSLLFLGGTFSQVDGIPHVGIAAIDSRTGDIDPSVDVQLAGDHGGDPTSPVRAPTGVASLALSPDGRTLVATGNFTSVDGNARDQIVELTLSSAGAAVNRAWATSAFATPCSSSSFDSWIRQAAFSPDGSYFVVVSTGGGHVGQLCDSAARFETAARGSNIAPTWVDRTGGDSVYAVAIDDAAVYIGGHERWLNNPNGHDAAQPGALPRPGIAALDPQTGLPLAWNPGRNPRGEGVFALLLTSDGLWVGMDTDCIGPSQPTDCETYVRPRIVLFPAGGRVPASTATAGLPGDVVSIGDAPGGVASDATSTTAFTGAGATSQPGPTPDGTAWSDARGAVLIGGTVFYGEADGTFHARPFDGRTWGPDRVVDPYDDPVWDSIRTGSDDADGNPILYQGVQPSFYAEIPQLTSLFYTAGRLYYTLAGQQALYWRDFQPDAGVISPVENTIATFDGSRVEGAFFAGSTLYWAAASDGSLHATAFSGRAPVAGSDAVVTGPGVADRDWRARGLLVMAPLLAAPTRLSALLDGATPTLRWTAPATADPDATVVVRRAAGTTPPATPDDPSGVALPQPAGSSLVDDVTVGATYSYTLWTVDPDGTQSAPVSITLTALPVPTVNLPTLVSDAGRTLTFTARWSAAHAVAYDVAWAPYGSGQRIWLGRTSTTSAVFGARSVPVAPVAGRTYIVAAAAYDAYGNRTRVGTAATTEPYDEWVAKTATSGWSSVASSSAWLGRWRTTKTKNARMVATLTAPRAGTRFAVIGTKSRSSGQFKVFIDGHYVATVGTWAGTTKPRQVLWTGPAVAAGRHTVGVINVANSGHPTITVDGYAVLPPR